MSHAAGHTRSHASPMNHQNAEIVAARTLTRTPALLEKKKCNSCGKLNHFGKVCGTVPPDSVKCVTEEGTDEDDCVRTRRE